MQIQTQFFTATLALLILLSPLTVLAQESPGDKFKKLMESTTPAQRADFQTEMMAENLNLDETQKEKIRTVNIKYEEKNTEIYNSETNRFKKFRQVKALRKDKTEELKGILTPTQYEAYLKNKDEMREKLKKKHLAES